MTKNQKRKFDFCCNYVMLGNAEEAAVKAGFLPEEALAEAVNCLKDSQCRAIISELSSILCDMSAVRSGLHRLAFGSCKDAVILAFADELPPMSVIEKLDLFNVSEIKRDKGGGVEIKLFDRLKALEKLCELELSNDSKNMAEGLIDAIISSAGGNTHED